eukprot:3784813-Rhodomonas_salina.1
MFADESQTRNARYQNGAGADVPLLEEETAQRQLLEQTEQILRIHQEEASLKTKLVHDKEQQQQQQQVNSAISQRARDAETRY